MKKTRQILSLLLCAALLLIYTPITVHAADAWDGSATAPTQGTGGDGDPYQIGTAEELAWFAGQVNAGNTEVCAFLTANIELNHTSDWENWGTNPPANTWTPIGNNTSKFAGSFDGNGYSVRGIYTDSGSVLGLFGCIGVEGDIQNIVVEESYISGSSSIGGVCGRNDGGNITGCYNYGIIMGSGNFVGGLCGENSGTITRCYNDGSVQGARSVGGIGGVNVAGGTVSGCGNAGSVTNTEEFAGGICGSLSAATEPRARIIDSFNTGTVQGTTTGGICGHNMQGSISGCYFLNDSGIAGVGSSYQGSAVTTGKPAEAFSSGEVAHLLGPLFGQALGMDQIPAARSSDGSNEVFKLTYLNGVIEHAVQYYNNSCTVSDVGIPIPAGSDGEFFLRWDNLPDVMPSNDVTAVAVFGAATVPSITTISLGNAVAGSAYLALIQAEGSRPITYSITSGTLPDGLSLDTGTGEISGNPVHGGTSTFVVQAENTTGSDTQELSITVEAAPSIITTSLPDGIVGVLYSTGIEAENSPSAFTVTSGSLPAGLSLDAATGVITGTPSTVGTNTFTIKSENDVGFDTLELSITVIKAAPTIKTTSLPSCAVGLPYSTEIEVEGKAPYTFSVSAGSLPIGLSLDENTGFISGTPTAVGITTFTIKAVNDAGEDTRQLSIEISDQIQGSGTSGDPYQIATTEQLIWFAGQVNGGRKGVHAVLMADIALNNTNGWENWADNPPVNTWTPIGINVTNRFVGSFNGNHHTISGVYINSSDDNQGLFGYIGVSTIQNISLTESYIKGKGYVGGICGTSFSTKFINCHNAGTINGTAYYVGGICGYNNATNTIEDCHNTGKITGLRYTGGITGLNSGTISGCRNEGTINSIGVGLGFGGVCGWNTDGSVTDSYNNGEVYAPNNNNVGGVCGYNLAAITNTYSTGTITGGSNTGEVCGYVTDTGIVTNSYCLEDKAGIGYNMGTGTATGKSEDAFASGEVAYLLGSSFGQTLSADTMPVFRTPDNGNAVYKLAYKNDDVEHAVQFYNSGNTVSAGDVQNPTTGSGSFLEWSGLPDLMPSNDVTVTAVFTTPIPVQLIAAAADGVAGTTTSTRIDLVFDSNIIGLTTDNITITDGTGSAAKGNLTGSGMMWSIALTSVIVEGNVSVALSSPEGYTVSGTPTTVAVYKLIPELSITTVSLAEAAVGSAYSQAIECSYTGGGRLEFSAVGLPGGLSINSDTGILTGIPHAGTQSGSPYSVVIEVTDGTLTDSGTYLLIVNTVQEPVIDTSSLPDGIAGETYSHSLSAMGDMPIMWSVESGVLPNGLALSAMGTITGIPTATGIYTFTVRAENSDGWDTQELSITINEPPSSFVAVTNIRNVPSAATVGVDLPLEGVVEPVNATHKSILWEVKDVGATGATIWGSDILSTTAPGIAVVTATIVNGASESLDYTQDFSITVNATPESATGITVSGTGGLFSVQAGSSLQMLADVLPATATNKSVVWTVESGSGAAISAEGLLRVTTVGMVTIRATAGDGSGVYGEALITVTEPPVTTHTVTFNSKGTIYAMKTVNDGESIGRDHWPSNPARTGYAFGGWYTGTNGSGTRFTASTTVDASLTVYAKWTSRGGSGGSRTPSMPIYNANLKAGDGSEQTLPITVNNALGSAVVDITAHNLTPGETVITIPSIPSVDTYSVGLPVVALSKPEGQGTLTLITDAGSMTIPYHMVTGISEITGYKVGITIGQGDKDALPEAVKNAIGGRPLIQLMLTVDGDQTDWNNPDAPVTISIPYTPTTVELANPESIIIWYIDGAGNVVTIPNGYYDAAVGTVTFTTTHFSDFAVAYNKVSFSDVAAGAWYKKAVGFIAARSITSGTGNGKYSPEATITRGEFIVLMMKAYGIGPDSNPTDNFSDAGNTYYTGYLAAAKRLGISAGVGNNLFAPGKEINRQEMFTLLYNALRIIGQLPAGDSGRSLSSFNDADDIARWAKDAMKRFAEAGIISGSGERLVPLGTTTRAQMAQVLYNLLVR